MAIHNRAGQPPAQQGDLINVAQLTAQYVLKPGGNAEHAVKFGTSGLAAAQVVTRFQRTIFWRSPGDAEERKMACGPCYVEGRMLSEPAFISVLEKCWRQTA